ncbi:hypothetical protein C8A03DRAFT_37476 [Achaetomium macrosporum]|uniref:Uncharacterized protein n=1 Tax=Achaetomium macrosporum TaxID=79813 RepID=A0AAN7C3I4_9PEZI|nr:hypothetical protein C8A03DRAFT_37476 [Achaetomium macrosporum]
MALREEPEIDDEQGINASVPTSLHLAIAMLIIAVIGQPVIRVAYTQDNPLSDYSCTIFCTNSAPSLAGGPFSIR